MNVNPRRAAFGFLALALVVVPFAATADAGDPPPAVRAPEPAMGVRAAVPQLDARPSRGGKDGKDGKKGKVTPIAGAERVQAPLGVDPACAPWIEVGIRNDTREAVYADMFAALKAPLTPSRPMVSSYLPPGYELGAKLLIGIPDGTPPGDYPLDLTVGREKLTVPVQVVGLADLDGGGNVALRRDVTASSAHTGGNYPACSVVDGDTGTDGWAGGNGWNDATSRAWPDLLDIDLGQVRQISRVDLHTLDTERYPAATYGLRDWDVQARVEGQWQTVAEVRGNTAGVRRADFAPVGADALRIVARASNGANDYARVIEVQAY